MRGILIKWVNFTCFQAKKVVLNTLIWKSLLKGDSLCPIVAKLQSPKSTFFSLVGHWTGDPENLFHPSEQMTNDILHAFANGIWQKS